jgi:ethanolamine utilization protein EutQ (cupin superfamily)
MTKPVPKKRNLFKEFSFPVDTINMAEITLEVRYPESGFVSNLASDMIVYVLEGKVELTIESRKIALDKGSAVCILKNQKYFWIPNNTVQLLIVSSPPWTADQQVKIEKAP